VGALVNGTGVPGSTTILSQSSGTPGGAGVYVTSNATTSSGNALTTNDGMTAASANQQIVQVRANQEPQLSAPDILVSVRERPSISAYPGGLPGSNAIGSFTIGVSPDRHHLAVRPVGDGHQPVRELSDPRRA
jgi:hypothetical protein